MSAPIKIPYGLNLSKKAGLQKSATAFKKRPVFGGGDDDSDDDAPVFGRNPKAASYKSNNGGAEIFEEAITELGDDLLAGNAPLPPVEDDRRRHHKSHALPTQPPPNRRRDDGDTGDANDSSNPTKPRGLDGDGDLASSLTARKHANAAAALDPSIYDYDAAYDAIKAATKAKKPDSGGGKGDNDTRTSQYMANLRKMAEVRERDRRIAEDKKMQRERAAEGDAFADKEMFVTDAYKEQQAEHRRLEEEERRREEAEAARVAAQGGAMTTFYKQLLDRDAARQAAIEAAEKSMGQDTPHDETEKADNDLDDLARARELNARGVAVAINDEGEVVDKRQLLQGGLNISTHKQAVLQRQRERERSQGHGRGGGPHDERRPSSAIFSDGRGKQAMRDRQSHMLAEQYEQTLKRTREAEDEQMQAAIEAAKSRKTAADISSARERYLARKRAEAEAKKAEEKSAES